MSGRWQRICRVNEVDADHPVGKVVSDPDGGDHRVCVAVRRGGELVVMLDRCPHRDIPLSRGLVRDGVLTCPGHFWRFDLTTGERSDLPHVRVTFYPTRITGGWVEASLPPPAPRRSMREWLLSRARADDSHGMVPSTTDTSPPVTSQEPRRQRRA